MIHRIYKEYIKSLFDPVEKEYLKINGQEGYKSRLYIPNERSKKLPLIVAFHGAGSRGSENRLQIRKKVAVTNIWLRYQRQYPCYVYAPQCRLKERWIETDWHKGNYDFEDINASKSFEEVEKTLEAILGHYDIDLNRIYIVGNSMGGFAVWYFLIKNPNLFAAALPICGGGDCKKIERLRNVPIWTCHGMLDTEIPVEATRQLYNALVNCGGNIQYTEYSELGHNVWDAFLQGNEGNNEVIEWLFAQSKEKRDNGVLSAPNK